MMHGQQNIKFIHSTVQRILRTRVSEEYLAKVCVNINLTYTASVCFLENIPDS
jgi:hypothetical protein